MQYTVFFCFPQDHLCAVKEMEELQSQLHKQKQQLQQTAQELEQLRKASGVIIANTCTSVPA